MVLVGGMLALAGNVAAQPIPGVQEKELRVFGQRIAYLESASNGPVVVLLHGLGGSSANWRLTIPALAGYRVIALDQIGAGRSDKPSLNYRVATLVEFLHEFLATAGIDRATLVGNSQGGWVAAAYAIAHPDKVERLVLVDAAGYSPARMNVPPPTREGLRRLNPSTLAGLRSVLELTFANKAMVTDALVRMAFEQKLAVNDAHVVNAFIESVLQGEDYVDGRLGSLRMPVLVLWGRDDALIPVSVADAWVADIPGAQRVVLDRCGHIPQLECFIAFNGAIQTFLGAAAR
jgi:pimeloyl-ACP methyl ester carboxylesterase